MNNRFYDILDIDVNHDCDYGWCVGILSRHDEDCGGYVYIYCRDEDGAKMLADQIMHLSKPLLQTVSDIEKAREAYGD